LKTLLKKSISVMLSLVLIMAMFPVFIMPVEAVTPTSNGQVWSRVQNLRQQLLRDGDYFSGNGITCGGGHTDCDNCHITVSMQRLGYEGRENNTSAHTCAATLNI
jgi:hypothetical protein